MSNGFLICSHKKYSVKKKTYHPKKNAPEKNAPEICFLVVLKVRKTVMNSHVKKWTVVQSSLIGLSNICQVHMVAHHDLGFMKILEKLPPYGRLFSSFCGELQPSAANSEALRAHFFWYFPADIFRQIFFRNFFSAIFSEFILGNYFGIFFCGIFFWEFFLGKFLSRIFFQTFFYQTILFLSKTSPGIFF